MPDLGAPREDGSDAAGSSEAEQAVTALERRVRAQAAALASVPACMPVPREVLALLSTVARDLDEVHLPARYLPRLATAASQVQVMINDLTQRERALAGRITAVRCARRAGQAPHLVDYSS